MLSTTCLVDPYLRCEPAIRCRRAARQKIDVIRFQLSAAEAAGRTVGRQVRAESIAPDANESRHLKKQQLTSAGCLIDIIAHSSQAFVRLSPVRAMRSRPYTS